MCVFILPWILKGFANVIEKWLIKLLKNHGELENWTQSKISLFRYKERMGSRKYKIGNLCASWLSLTCAWGELANTALARWSKSFSSVTSHVNSIYCWYHVMITALHHEGLPPQILQPQSNLETNIWHVQIGSQNLWPVFLKIVHVIKIKETQKLPQYLKRHDK